MDNYLQILLVLYFINIILISFFIIDLTNLYMFNYKNTSKFNYSMFFFDTFLFIFYRQITL